MNLATADGHPNPTLLDFKFSNLRGRGAACKDPKCSRETKFSTEIFHKTHT